MAASLEETFILVWRQVMVEDTKVVVLRDEKFPVRRTSRSRLREVDFRFEGPELRGLEQNPETGTPDGPSTARRGQKVMQFLKQRRYVAVVVDGKVQLYGHAVLEEFSRGV